MRTEKTEVLVIGGGPVGLFSALQLAAQGVSTVIVEREVEQLGFSVPHARQAA